MTLYFERTGPSDAPTVLLLRPIAGTIALWGAFRDQLAEHWSVVACEARVEAPSEFARVVSSFLRAG